MDGGEPQEPWFCDGKTTILPQVKTRAKKVATTTEVMIANCLGCNPCVSTPKMIFSLRREVKSSDFMRVSVMLPFSFSRTFQKRYGKLCGPFRGEEREDSKPLPHPVLRRHIALHIVFRGIRLGVLGEEEILQRLDAPVHGGSNSLHTLLVDEFLGAGECLPDILVNAVQLGEVQPVKRGLQPQRVSALR